jgi:hypothetical protein
MFESVIDSRKLGVNTLPESNIDFQYDRSSCVRVIVKFSSLYLSGKDLYLSSNIPLTIEWNNIELHSHLSKYVIWYISPPSLSNHYRFKSKLIYDLTLIGYYSSVKNNVNFSFTIDFFRTIRSRTVIRMGLIILS